MTRPESYFIRNAWQRLATEADRVERSTGHHSRQRVSGDDLAPYKLDGHLPGWVRWLERATALQDSPPRRESHPCARFLAESFLRTLPSWPPRLQRFRLPGPWRRLKTPMAIRNLAARTILSGWRSAASTGAAWNTSPAGASSRTCASRRSATSTFDVTGQARQDGRAQLRSPSRRSSKTFAGCSTTSRSTPSRSPRPTTGTPSRRSGPARPARTSTSRSRSATTSAKDGGWSRPPGSTTGSSRPARSAAATRASRTRSPFCARASSGRSTWPRGFATSRAGSIGHKADSAVPAGRRLRPLARAGPRAAVQPQSVPLQLALVLGLRQRRPRQPGHPSDGPGPLGIGQERVAQGRAGLRRPIRLFRRRPDAQHAARRLRVRRLRASIRGPRAATPTTKPRSRSATSSTEPRGSWRSPATRPGSRSSGPSSRKGPGGTGGGDHFANFVKAVKARDRKILNGRHRRGPPLERLLPPGQHRLPARPQAANSPLDRVVRRRFRGRRDAHARVSRAVCRAGQGLRACRIDFQGGMS